MDDICFQGFQEPLNSNTSQSQSEILNEPQKQFVSVEEARGLLSKSYSLQPDMLHGWIPKIPSIPMPLYYGSCLEPLKFMIRQDETYKIVYEWKNTKYNTVKLHQGYNYTWQKRSQYDIKWRFLEEAVETIGKPKQTNIGTQMSDKQQKHDYKFDSDFQSGNLQMAVRVKPDEFDCYLRSDSNTTGHTNWYYFTVQNFIKLGTIKINICNLRKTKNLYGKGMAPYVQLEGHDDWSQQPCEEVNFLERYCRHQNNVKCHILQFRYTFTMPNQVLHVAYCVPYTYSKLQNFIKEIEPHRDVQYLSLGESFSSLSIPLLKITNPKSSSIPKKTILMIGRTHPGEANSSWVVQGIIKELLSDTNLSTFLKEKFEFLIIPMLNVDGVVLGNFRCGGQGTDFNRCFDGESCEKTIQVKHVIDLVKTLKSRGNRLQFVIDFHGHSQKQNCFFYGPQFHPSNQYYTKSRLLSKIFQQKCPSFQYKYSDFNIPQYKKTTARSYMNTTQKIPMVFTLQVSNGVYEINKQRRQYNRKDFESIGSDLLKALYEYARIEDSISEKLKLIETKKGVNWLARNRSSFRLNGTQQRYSIRRFYAKVKESQQFSKKGLVLKRTSLNMETQISPQTKDGFKDSCDHFIEDKIIAMIQEVDIEKQKDLKAQESNQSDFESEQDDFNEAKRIQIAKQVQSWTNQLTGKSLNKSCDKNPMTRQKSFFTIPPKTNALSHTQKRQSLLSKSKIKDHQNPQLSTYEKSQSQLRNAQKKLTKVVRGTFKPLISQTSKKIPTIIKPYKTVNNVNGSKSKQLSANQTLQIYDLSRQKQQRHTLAISAQNFTQLYQKARQVQRSSLKWTESTTITSFDQTNQEKRFPLTIKLSSNQKAKQPIKLSKSSIWKNTSIKNLLRSNRFPFVLQKFA